MLESIRHATKSWFGTAIMWIVMGFLILSFAVWGIGDVFTGFRADRVAQVGDTSISAEQVRTSYQRELQALQQQHRRLITNQEARQAGLDTMIVTRLVTQTLLDQEAQRLGLGISDEDIARSILNDQTFKGSSGQFDRALFDEILRQNGYNEATFVREQRAVYLRRQIGDAVGGSIKVPQTALETFHRYQNESRTVEAITFPAAAAGEIPAPGQEELQKYFDDRKAAYRAPEYRTITVLALTPGTAARPQDVSEADALARYEQIKHRFGTAERRQILQLVFPNAEEAAAASQKIKDGASFESIAAERNVALADIDLGLKTKADLFDKAIADAAFALPDQGVSEPIQGNFGTVILKIAKREPEAVKPFAEVAAEVRQEVARERAGARVQDLHDKVEDQRASGRPLAEAAQEAGLEVRSFEPVDANGRTRDGKEIADLPERAALLRAAFDTDVGNDNEALTTADRGYVWYAVDHVDLARERTLDEVRAQVEAQWRADEVARRLTARAADLVRKINAGEETLQAVADWESLTVETIPGITRAGGGNLPQNAVLQVFNVGPTEAGSAAMADGGRLLFKVRDTQVPPFDPEAEASKQLASQLANAYADDVLSEYLAELQARAGVTINQQALNMATGAAEPN